MPNDLSLDPPRPVTIDDLARSEARTLAREAIQTELEKSGLPLPRDSVLDTHIDELLRARPDFLVAATERVEAKKDAYTRALRAIGIEPIIVEALDLE
jgi:hypothetical protein